MPTTICRAGVFVLIIGLSLLSPGLLESRATAAPPAKEDPHLGLTQNWDKVLPASQRFIVLDAFNNQAVRDNETGLVWEKSPVSLGQTDWTTAYLACANSSVGNRKGWRLPSHPELASLVEPSAAGSGLTLPVGHPFVNVQASNYWSGAANVFGAPIFGWNVDFGTGTDSKLQLGHVWCVRGAAQQSAF